MFENQVYDYPNIPVDSAKLNNYVWAYIIGPLLGGATGGFLFLLHSKCVDARGRDNSISIDLKH